MGTLEMDVTSWGKAQIDVEEIEDFPEIDSETIESYFEPEDFEVEEFFCPNCGKTLSEKDIEKGFRKWMDKIKREDPKLYASLLSEML